MSCAQSLKLIINALPLLLALGCAQFQETDRELVNKPAMSIQSSPFIKGKTTLTNQKSNSNSSVGSCTVCAH